MSPEDWDLIYRVHVLGAYRVTAAAWPHLRDQKYGRVIFTASAAGIYGNFGQANYSDGQARPRGLREHPRPRGQEDQRAGQHHRPHRGLAHDRDRAPQGPARRLKPEYVSPLVAWLCHESNGDTGGLYEVGGGFIGKLRWERTEGATWRLGRGLRPRDLRDRWARSPTSRRRAPGVRQRVDGAHHGQRRGRALQGAATSSSTSTRRSATSSPLDTSLRRARHGPLRAGRRRGRDPLDPPTSPTSTSSTRASTRCPPTRWCPVVNGILDMGPRRDRPRASTSASTASSTASSTPSCCGRCPRRRSSPTGRDQGHLRQGQGGRRGQRDEVLR
jgi:hypothetical protein